MALRRMSPMDASWLALESRDTPMHVGGLYEFTKPDDAGDDYLNELVELMKSHRTVPPPWNLKLVEGPLVGPRLPVFTEDRDLDLDYHVRHSALPHPGGQRELGILVSRLHSHQLDLHRPLWEAHLIEGLEDDKFALYVKMHHSLIDGVSGIRMNIRALTEDPDERGMEPFWTVGEGSGRSSSSDVEQSNGGGLPIDPGALFGGVRGGASALMRLGSAGLRMGRASVDSSPLRPPYSAPHSVLGKHITGQRRFATQQYELDLLKQLADEGDCTLNDIVLYLSSSALRRYLQQHASLPSRSLTAGIPVSLRDPGDESTGTSIGLIVASLGTNIGDPRARLEEIARSTEEAKNHLRSMPRGAHAPYTLLTSAPYVAGLLAGLGSHAPVPFNVTISNVPGPKKELYYNGARLDALSPLSLLTQGSALNITCLSYAGTLNFGLTGARDRLPHLQRLAIYMRESLDEITDVMLDGKKPKSKAKKNAGARSNGSDPARKGSRSKK